MLPGVASLSRPPAPPACLVSGIRCICMITAQWPPPHHPTTPPQQVEGPESAQTSSLLPFAPLPCKAAADWPQGPGARLVWGGVTPQPNPLYAWQRLSINEVVKGGNICCGGEGKVFHRKPLTHRVGGFLLFFGGVLFFYWLNSRGDQHTEAKWSSSSASGGRSPLICSELSFFSLLIPVVYQVCDFQSDQRWEDHFDKQTRKDVTQLLRGAPGWLFQGKRPFAWPSSI